MSERTVPVPAVRPPVDKPQRLVGVSHSNNSNSLVDHVTAADSLHNVIRIVLQNVCAILDDVQYYKTPELQAEFQALKIDFQELGRDASYEETRDNYHHHFWKADFESESKYLITKLSQLAHALVDYKQTCCDASRNIRALDQAYWDNLCDKHLQEIRNFRQEIAPNVNEALKQTSQVNQLSAPLYSSLQWRPGTGPLDDPEIRRPLPNECTITTRETIRHQVYKIPNVHDIPDYSGRPAAMNSGTDATLSSAGRYGGRHIYEQSINARRFPVEQEIRHVSSRYKHIHGFCE
ncbi:uncharacterized protein LOC117107270 [Anneissia japonica]|uniref:uncharacterized protein LOC117107270 n=1 Tax=Anneissia japonica TaxID=1529436 RepID=UPI0014257999|nr:uncharacterized protein LOC117107270 [Anneissia japonica]